MPANHTFPQKLEEVRQRIRECYEEGDDGPMDSLLDWHLPNLHVAINGLYAAIGDTRRLESAQAASDEARKSELESADDLPFFAKD